MSFPNVVFGNYGDEFADHDTAQHELGTRLILPDGREFRYAKAGGSALVGGTVQQSAVPGANFDELAVAAAAAVGSQTVTVTTGATAVTENQFAGGYLNVEDDAGEGRLYKIKSHPAAGTTASLVITLEDNQPIQEALTTNSTVGLTSSPFDGVIIQPSPCTAIALGVAVTDVTASQWGWLQTKGPASVLTNGTIVIAQQVMCSDAVDGAVEDLTLTEGAPNTIDDLIVGRVMEVAADTEHSLVWLTID